MTEYPVGLCGSCGARILFARMASGKRMPLDEKEVTGYEINEDGFGVFRRIRISHFATCPKAENHRKGGRGEGTETKTPA